MRLFFPPQLRVRIEDVARPLPGVLETVQFAAEGVLGEVQPSPLGQMRFQQGDSPLGGKVATILGRLLQQVQELAAALVIQPTGTSAAVQVGQGGGVVPLSVGVDPVIDNTRRHTQASGDLGDGLTAGDLKNSQGAAIHTGIVGGAQLPFQAPPLPGGQS